MELIHGNIAYSGSCSELAVFDDSYIAVENGRVAGIFSILPDEYASLPVTDYGDGIIIPAFTDMHIHAPQYAQRGTGMDLLLPDWLENCTFPEEARFSDTDYARRVYTLLVEDMIRNGTFHACVFGSIHTESTRILADIMEEHGMRGFVGKVNMDRSSPEYYCESTDESIYETEKFISCFDGTAAVKPILTPRFAPTCSWELLKGLGKLAAKYGCGMQTHLVESRWEAAEALRLFPDCSCDAEIYEKVGLMDNGPTVFAHFIFPTENDIAIAKKHSALTVHCPEATNNIIAGIMPASRLKELGIEIASGTDIGAGARNGVYHQIAAGVQISKLRDFYEPGDSRALSFPEAFCMASKTGGELFGDFGSFEKGYVFDALVLDVPVEPESRLSTLDRIERFCYIGDDRNITARYINGNKID